MNTLAPILFISVILNVLLLRWAVGEYQNRRQWQQEATLLQKALRSLNPEAVEPMTKNYRLLWLLVILSLLFGIWIASMV